MSTLKPDYFQLGQSQRQLQHIFSYVGTKMSLQCTDPKYPYLSHTMLTLAAFDPSATSRSMTNKVTGLLKTESFDVIFRVPAFTSLNSIKALEQLVDSWALGVTLLAQLPFTTAGREPDHSAVSSEIQKAAAAPLRFGSWLIDWWLQWRSGPYLAFLSLPRFPFFF